MNELLQANDVISQYKESQICNRLYQCTYSHCYLERGDRNALQSEYLHVIVYSSSL